MFLDLPFIQKDDFGWVTLCFYCIEGVECATHVVPQLRPINIETDLIRYEPSIQSPEPVLCRRKISKRRVQRPEVQRLKLLAKVSKVGKKNERTCSDPEIFRQLQALISIPQQKSEGDWEVTDKTGITKRRGGRKKRKQKPRFLCDLCDESFTLRHNVQTHLINHHIPGTKFKKIEIETTSVEEKNGGRLAGGSDRLLVVSEPAKARLTPSPRNANQGSGKPLHICSFCSKTFTAPSQLKEHVSIFHLNERNFKCDQCDQAFGRRGGLRRHVQMVHMNHLYKCPFEDCGHPGYKCSKALTAHIHSVHTMTRPFECDACPKTFVRRNDLRMHTLTHNSDRAFACSCGSRYRRLPHLRKHQKSCLTFASSAPLTVGTVLRMGEVPLQSLPSQPTVTSEAVGNSVRDVIVDRLFASSGPLEPLPTTSMVNVVSEKTDQASSGA